MNALVGVVPRLPPTALLGPRPQGLPFPLEDRRCTLWSTSTVALVAGLRAIGLRPGDEMLVPVERPPYLDGALAATGVRPRPYSVDAALEPDPATFGRPPGSARLRALYLVHDLGFPADARRWQAWCRERDLLLVEDVCQSWTATVGDVPLGSFGAAAVFSLTLGFGLPDGAALVCEPVAPAPTGAAARGLGWPDGSPWREPRWPPELLLAPGRQPGDRPRRGAAEASSPPSTLTLRLLPLVADAHAGVRRRAHYAMLLDGLADRVASGFEILPPSAAPLAFPLVTDNPEAVRVRLAAAGIAALRTRPSAPAGDRFARGSSDVLLLPTHQHLRPRHVESMLTVTRDRRRRRPRVDVDIGVPPETLRPDWARLAERAGNIFATPEWAMTWWQHFGSGHELCLTACRDSHGRLIAVLPLCLTKLRGLRLLRFVGHGPADQLGPVCAPDDRPAAARALRRAVRELRADVLLGDSFSAAEGWDALLGARVITREPTPVVRFPSRDWQQLLAMWPKQIARRHRRTTRELERQPGGLTYRLSLAPEGLAADMDALMTLHLAQRAGRASSFAGEHAAFHRDFARVALERGWLRLLFAEVGRPIAATYGFDYAGASYFYNGGRDSSWDRWSVGTLILVESMRRSQADGRGEYRLLRGSEPYKLRFANADPGLQTIAISRWPAGGSALRLAAVARTSLVKPALRRLGR